MNLSNTMAAIRIFMKNFWYDHSVHVWLVIGGVILIGLVVLLLRAALCRVAHTRFQPTPPDETVTERAAESLSQAISFETTKDNAPAFEAFYAYLRDRYPLVFARIDVTPIKEHSLLLQWRGKKTGRLPILFAAHMDVVPAGDGWTHEPFSGERDDRIVWGRGAIDCKNVMIGLLESAEQLLSEGFSPMRDIYFAFGHDEEIGGAEGASTMARLLQKKGVRLAMVLDEGGAVLKGAFGHRYATVAQVGVAEKGMFNVELTAAGEPGHASAPGAHTAVGSLAEAICRIEAAGARRRMTPLIRDYYKKSAGLMPFGKRLLCANLGFFRGFATRRLAKGADKAYFSSTMAVTTAEGGTARNVLPESASANINVRLLQGDTKEKALLRIKDLVYDLPVSVEIAEEGSEASPVSAYDGEMFELLSKTVTERFGPIPVVPSLFKAATDSRYYEEICPCVYRFMPFVLTPAELSAMHGVDEHIPEDSLGMAVEFYVSLIRRLS